MLQHPSIEHIQILEKKNKHLAQKLDDMSKKMDAIIKILEFIMNEFPQLRIVNMPDGLKGILNSNFKAQNNNMLSKLYETQQQMSWNGINNQLGVGNLAQNQIAQALKQFQMQQGLNNFSASQLQAFEGLTPGANSSMNQLMAMAWALLQPNKPQNGKTQNDLGIAGGGQGHQSVAQNQH